MYIRKTELEWLLLHYHDLRGLLEELEEEAKAVKSERAGDDDEIYSRVTKRNVDGMPFATGRITDRTAAAVVDRGKAARELKKAIKEILDDILLVSIILSKLSIGFRRLRSQERVLIEEKYFKGRTWKEISHDMKYDTRTISRFKDNALEKVTNITRISLDDYQKIRNLLEGM